MSGQAVAGAGGQGAGGPAGAAQAAADATAAFRLDGRTALVTGAGRGLGADIALTLAGAGAHLVLLSRSEAELAEVAGRIERAHGDRPDILVCDLTDAPHAQACIEALPALDILVNNAGTNRPQAFVDVGLDALDALLALNLRAAFAAAQAAARRMLRDPDRARRGGAIVNMSSQMGHVGSGGRSVYCLTKHGIEGLTKAAAVELAPHGITVSTVCPTFARTPMTQAFFQDKAFSDWVHDRIPRGRLVTTQEVAQAVLYLVSPAAAMVTGSALLLDGGWTAQ